MPYAVSKWKDGVYLYVCMGYKGIKEVDKGGRIYSSHELESVVEELVGHPTISRGGVWIRSDAKTGLLLDPTLSLKHLFE